MYVIQSSLLVLVPTYRRFLLHFSNYPSVAPRLQDAIYQRTIQQNQPINNIL